MIQTRLYKNVTDKKVRIPVTGDEIAPGEVYSVTTEYHQPILVPGVVEITEMTTEEVKKVEKEAKDGLKK